MKVAFSIKSDYLFSRMLTASEMRFKDLSVEFEKSNKNDERLIRNAIDYYNVKFLVIDESLPEETIKAVKIKQEENEKLIVLFFNDNFEQTLDRLGELIKEVLSNTILLDFNHDNTENLNEREPPEKVPVVEVETVVEEKVVEKEIEVEVTSYANLPKRTIGVVSLFESCGSTTVAINLARAFAERNVSVSYIEHPLNRPYVFDYLAIPNKETEDNTYKDLAQMIANDQIKLKQKAWHYKGVDWHVLDSRKKELSSFTYEQMLKMVYNTNSTITIVDFSSNLHHKDVQNYLHQIDELYVVYESDVIKLDRMGEIVGEEIQRKEKVAADFIRDMLEAEENKVHFINAKYSKSLNNKFIEQVFEVKTNINIPIINYKNIMECVWNSIFLYDQREFRSDFETQFKTIIRSNLPKELYRLNPKKSKVDFFKRSLLQKERKVNEETV